MAAVKSAARMRLLAPASIADLFTDLNRVLFAIKRANLFATATCLQIEGSRIEYGLAGHLPILHWKRATRQVVRLSEGEIALGILESARYEQRPIEVGPGDVLVVVTDGLTEVADRHDREIGLEGIEAALAAHAEEPLDRLIDQILRRVRRHGPQRDDQTLLLMRIVAEA
jgi:serine phosphatase RsbU (regulator of sigma subunit)